MKTLLRGSVVVAVVFVVGCGGGDAPPVPATITFTPDAVTLDAIGATSALSVVVNDDKGRPIDNAPVVWTAAGTAVTLTPPATNATGSGTHAASVTAVSEGQTLVKVTSASVSATLNVVVDQQAVAIVSISGDNQVAAPGHALGQPLAVQLRDRLGVPLTDGSVAFDIVDGGGSISPSPVSPTSDGIARATWTLGAGVTTQHVSVSDAAHRLTPVTFTATASETAGIPTALVVAQGGGGNQALLAGASATPPAVKVVDATGTGVPGILVTFSVTAGGGSINTTTGTTGADGIASLASWTMGPVGALNTVTATVPGLLPLNVDDAGCDNGAATGFAITLCYRTTMTASQRQAFVNAAARWGSIITGDLVEITAEFTGVCGGSVPVYNGTVDDLLIFADVEPIDGPSNIVGSAGPCIIRNPGGVLTQPIIGTMRFDVADVVALENRGLLNAVILHEMGHVLGIGPLWQAKNLLVNPSTTSQQLDTFFNGVNGIAGFDAIGGTSYTGGSKVPVENKGGTGTINGHWREDVLQNELMTGTINNSANPLSLLTVRSLQDLGYIVNTSSADPFFLTLASRLPGGATERISLGQDILTFPLWTVDARGHVNRIPR
jgi:hypothetical protein